MKNLINAKIIATGRAVPSTYIVSDDLDAQLGLELGTLFSKTGVKGRYVADAESQIDLAIEASQKAIAQASLGYHDIDMILCASAVPYQTIPSTAPLIQRSLGIKDGQAFAFDVNSTCLSFVTALQVAQLHVQSGAANNVLIVSSELASRSLPWQKQPDVAALFGDGAAACIISATDGADSTFMHHMRSYPSSYEACQIGAGGTKFNFHEQSALFAEHTRFSMDGRALFRLTMKHFKNFVQEILDKAQWTASDVDLIIPHQASPYGLKHLIKSLDFDAAKFINIVEDYGNQIAASIPFALDMAHQQGRIKDKMKILFLGTSAGVSFGGIAYEC